MIPQRKFIICLLPLLPLVLYATCANAAIGKQGLQDYFDQLQGLSAEFEQTVLSAQSEIIQNSRGLLTLLRPNKFRWDYRSPFEQLIVANGKNIWIYDTDLEQVSIRSFDETMEGTPALLLSMDRPIEDSYIVTELGIKDGLEWFELKDRNSDSGFLQIRLAFSQNTLQLMEIDDSFGQMTRIHFINLQRNPEIDPNTFEFIPPAGIDVVGVSVGE